MSLSAPVVFFAFNRPDVTQQSFARIAAQRPSTLFVFVDGPREDVPSDQAACAAVRDIVTRIDWPCDARVDIATTNAGLRRQIPRCLNRVFSIVDRAIIVEDDLLPHDDFFTFCEDLLTRYVDDERISAIAGFRWLERRPSAASSYYFSKYPAIWGWATWARAWRLYDPQLEFWPEWSRTDEWRQLNPIPAERRYWASLFDQVKEGRIETWDYQWLASVWFHGGLAATPNVNLVTNVGFGPDATNTKVGLIQRPPSPIGPLRHPPEVAQDVAEDRRAMTAYFPALIRPPIRRPGRLARWASWRVRAMVRSTLARRLHRRSSESGLPH